MHHLPQRRSKFLLVLHFPPTPDCLYHYSKRNRRRHRHYCHCPYCGKSCLLSVTQMKVFSVAFVTVAHVFFDNDFSTMMECYLI